MIKIENRNRNRKYKIYLLYIKKTLMPRLTLISSKNLAFTKPNCGCGIVSSEKRKDFIKSNKKHKNINKKIQSKKKNK
jgi:hypothetical protein